MTLRGRLSARENKIRSWEGDDPKRRRMVYFAAYSVSFAVVAFIALFVYPSNGRSIVWSVDGLEQFYPFFMYEGQWLREVVSNLLSGQAQPIPLWSYDLGYGSDILSTLDVFFDPLNLLSGLCPEQYSEFLFQFLVVFRLYLAGLAFSALALRFKMERFPTLIAALLYALCGTALAVGFWPAGAWPLVLFPLLLLGVEKVLAGERPYVFILVAAAFFAISYYFSYMACLFLIVYCTVRVIMTQKPLNVGRFLLWVARFLGLLVVGVLMACVALIPSLIGLFGSDRVSEAVTQVPLFYSLAKYGSWPGGFLSTAEVGSDCYIGFGGLALVACSLLFLRPKQNRLLKAAFIAATIILLVPACGSVLNGFNYATNRWVWAYALIVCFIVARMLPELMHASKREVKMLVVIAAVYGLVVWLLPQSRNEKTMAALAVVMAVLVVVALRDVSLRAKQTGLAACLVAGLTLNAFYFVSPDEGGVGASSSPVASLYTKLVTDSVNSLVVDVDDESLWRYDGDPTATKRTRNDSLVLGLQGVDFYNSTYNSYIDQYHTELGVSETQINFSYKHLDGRSILETLSGVKYYVIPLEAGIRAPYNYNDETKLVNDGVRKDHHYGVYEAEQALPLAYTYSSSISRETYEAFSPAQRQEALLQGVVLEDSSLPQTQVQLTSQTVPSQVVGTNGLTIENGVIKVDHAGATLQLTCEGLPNSETYLYVNDLDYVAKAPRDMVDKKEYASMSWYQRANLLKKSIGWSAAPEYSIELVADKGAGKRHIDNTCKDWHMYGGKSEWLINLGYSTDAQSTITATFNRPGEYSYSELSVVCQPMGSFDDQVEALAANPVDDLTFSTNEITGSVDLSQPEAVYFSVAYSKGWSATVDGEPLDINRANTGFMAVELEPGHHDIKLTYRAPGLVEGLALTGVGFAVFALIVVAYGVAGRKQRLTQQGASQKKGQ